MRKRVDSLWGKRYFIVANRKNKVGKKWVWPGIIIGRFGNRYALVHFRWPYFEVDLGDMRSSDSLFVIIGCGGALTLHIPSTKFPIHYLAGSQTLVFLTKMRNGYLRGNQTTRVNADTRIPPLTFYEPDLRRRFDVREMGGGAFNDVIGRLGNMGEVKHEKGMGKSIVESESLIRGQRVYNNSPGKTKFRHH